MKPLTVEELKALKVGDWVWISRSSNNKTSGYVTDIDFTAKMFTCKSVNRVATTARIADYGTTWLAYKNKEEAEGVYDKLQAECDDKERYTIELYNRAREAERRFAELKEKDKK